LEEDGRLAQIIGKALVPARGDEITDDTTRARTARTRVSRGPSRPLTANETWNKTGRFPAVAAVGM
jgi:hypothetical protein